MPQFRLQAAVLGMVVFANLVGDIDDGAGWRASFLGAAARFQPMALMGVPGGLRAPSVERLQCGCAFPSSDARVREAKPVARKTGSGCMSVRFELMQPGARPGDAVESSSAWIGGSFGFAASESFGGEGVEAALHFREISAGMAKPTRSVPPKRV